AELDEIAHRSVATFAGHVELEPEPTDPAGDHRTRGERGRHEERLESAEAIQAERDPRQATTALDCHPGLTVQLPGLGRGAGERVREPGDPALEDEPRRVAREARRGD